jgi:hypothetical protein
MPAVAAGGVLSSAKPPMTPAVYCCCCCCTLVPAVVVPFLLIAAFTASSQATSAAATVATVQRLGAIDPLAVCNDGTAGAYHFAPFTDAAKARRWLVWLDGGDFCESESECAGRKRPGDNWGALMSSADVADEKTLGGLMSSDAPTFGGANLASVHYCSSDQHTGDRAASEETYGLHFRGQRIVKAVLKDLASPGKGLRSGDQLTLAGCSAGSNGAEQLCDFVQGWVPENVSVSCIFDSPLSAIDVPTLDGFFAPRVPVGESQLITVSGKVSRRVSSPISQSHALEPRDPFTLCMVRLADTCGCSLRSSKVGDPARPSTVDLWNTTAVLSPACVASRASKDDLWQCNWAQFTLKFHTSKHTQPICILQPLLSGTLLSTKLCLRLQRPTL